MQQEDLAGKEDYIRLTILNKAFKMRQVHQRYSLSEHANLRRNWEVTRMDVVIKGRGYRSIRKLNTTLRDLNMIWVEFCSICEGSQIRWDYRAMFSFSLPPYYM